MTTFIATGFALALTISSILFTQPNMSIPMTGEKKESVQIYEVGDSVNLSGLDVLVEQYYLAKTPEGEMNLFVHVNIYNHVDEEIEMIEECMQLYNENGKAQQMNKSIIHNEATNEMIIEPGEYFERKVAFSISKGGTYEFIVESPFQTKKAKWIIEI